jgi:hypothetical protein
VSLYAARELLKPGLVCAILCSHTNPGVMGLTDFSDVFEHFNNLRHDNDSLDYFLEDDWYFDELFLSDGDCDWHLLDAIDDLKHFFNIVNVPHHFFEFFSVDELLDSALYLHDFSSMGIKWYNLFLLTHDFLHRLDDCWYFH